MARIYDETLLSKSINVQPRSLIYLLLFILLLFIVYQTYIVKFIYLFISYQLAHKIRTFNAILFNGWRAFDRVQNFKQL